MTRSLEARQVFDRLTRKRDELETLRRDVQRKASDLHIHNQDLEVLDLSTFPDPLESALKGLRDAWRKTYPRRKTAPFTEAITLQVKDFTQTQGAFNVWHEGLQAQIELLEEQRAKMAPQCPVQHDPDNLIELEPGRASHMPPHSYQDGSDARIQAAGFVRAGVPGVGAYHAGGHRLGGGPTRRVRHHTGYALYAEVAADDVELARLKRKEVSVVEVTAYQMKQGHEPHRPFESPQEREVLMQAARDGSWDFSDVP